MSKSEVSIAIPDELIKGVVMAEMVKALGSREEMITAVVRASFEAKDPASYGRSTLFQTAVQKAINEAAVAAFTEWLTEHAALVKSAVLAQLNKRKREFADQLANALLDGRFYVKPSIHVEIGTLTER